MTSLTKNPHPPQAKKFFSSADQKTCRVFGTFTGSVEHTGPEKFPRKATCVQAFFSETTQRQPVKFYLKHKLDACQVSPAVTHGIPKKQRKNHAKQQIQTVVERLENAFNTFVKHCVAIKVGLNFLEMNAQEKASDLLNLMLVVTENLLSAKSYLQKMEQKLMFSMLFVSGLPLHVYYIICRSTCQLLF